MTVNTNTLCYGSLIPRRDDKYTQKQCKWLWVDFYDEKGDPVHANESMTLYPTCHSSNKKSDSVAMSYCNQNCPGRNECWEQRDEEWLQFREIARQNDANRENAKIKQRDDFFASLSPEDQQRFAKYKNSSISNVPFTREKLEAWEYHETKRLEWLEKQKQSQ